jgi:hypothetical protein
LDIPINTKGGSEFALVSNEERDRCLNLQPTMVRTGDKRLAADERALPGMLE